LKISKFKTIQINLHFLADKDFQGFLPDFLPAINSIEDYRIKHEISSNYRLDAETFTLEAIIVWFIFPFLGL